MLLITAQETVSVPTAKHLPGAAWPPQTLFEVQRLAKRMYKCAK